MYIINTNTKKIVGEKTLTTDDKTRYLTLNFLLVDAEGEAVTASGDYKLIIADNVSGNENTAIINNLVSFRYIYLTTGGSKSIKVQHKENGSYVDVLDDTLSITVPSAGNESDPIYTAEKSGFATVSALSATNAAVVTAASAIVITSSAVTALAVQVDSIESSIGIINSTLDDINGEII